MASISREKNGRRTIQFVAGDKKRKSIRLGKVSQRVAEAVKIRVEHLNAATIHGHAIAKLLNIRIIVLADSAKRELLDDTALEFRRVHHVCTVCIVHSGLKFDALAPAS